MAIIPLGTVTTRGANKSYIRANAGVLSENETMVFEEQLDDIIQDALLSVRTQLHGLIGHEYLTRINISGAIVDNTGHYLQVLPLNGLNIFKFSSDMFNIWDSTLNKSIPIIPDKTWNLYIQYFGLTRLTNSMFARFMTVTGKDDTYHALQIFRGSGMGSGSNSPFVSYPRNPYTPVTDATIEDMLESFTPLVREVALMLVNVRVKGQTDDVQNKIASWLGLNTKRG